MTDDGSDGPDAPARGWRRALPWAERALWVAVLAFVAVRLAPQFSALTGVPSPGAHPVEGAAPSWSAVTLEGDTLTSDALRGSVVVVNFWATWCPPCRFEIPSLEKLWKERRDDGLVVVGLSKDRAAGDAVRDFLSERDVTYPVGMSRREVERAFGGIPGMPTTFVVDRDGVVRHRVFGYFAPPAMRAAVGRLLDEPPDAGSDG